MIRDLVHEFIAWLISLTVQLDQLNIAVLSLYSSVHWTSHFLQGTSNTRPCISGEPVYSVGPSGCGKSFITADVINRDVHPNNSLRLRHFFTIY